MGQDEGPILGLGSKPKYWVVIPHYGQALAPDALLALPSDPVLPCSFTTTTKESHSRPFSLHPSEPCDRPWEGPHTCSQPT